MILATRIVVAVNKIKTNMLAQLAQLSEAALLLRLEALLTNGGRHSQGSNGPKKGSIAIHPKGGTPGE